MMTTPLGSLLAFVAWAIVLLLAIGASRLHWFRSGRARPADFTAGVPHGPDAYWRLNRAHRTCVEPLPLFASVVLVATALDLHRSALDTLALVVVAARVAQSVVHVGSASELAIHLRFFFFLLQIVAIVGFLGVIAVNV